MDFITKVYDLIVKFVLDLLDLCKVDTSNLPEWLASAKDAE